MLKGTVRNEGGDPVPHGNRVDEPPTLIDLGITRKTSALAQKLSGLPADQVASIAKRDQSITQVLRKETAEKMVKQERRKAKESDYGEKEEEKAVLTEYP